MKLIKSILGNIELTGEVGNWNISASSDIPEQGLELVHLKFTASEAAVPPHVTLSWNTPQLDIQSRWFAPATFPLGRFQRHCPPNWHSAFSSSLASCIPLMDFFNLKGKNRVLVAFSDAMRQINLTGGVCEPTNCIDFRIELFSVPEAPISSCELTLRLDTRDIFYADAIRSAMEWYAAFPDYTPSPVPEAAFDPIYSTWYSYHHEVFASQLEPECALAAEDGMKSIILDDGWQTEENTRGYAFCGDWELSKRRFPDMRSHVEKIHKLGMKYIVWYSVPFIGKNSRNYERFRSKILYLINGETGVFDPRFPEVREFLISTYETALKEWDIDGLKLDFIDQFKFEGEDPAVKENYAGRDIQSLPKAVDRLLSDVMTRLRKIKPDILIEFRQTYIGPAIRKYGNMLRSSDCPADILSNRVNTLDLRLTSGNTAVHSDMLEWNSGDSAETAALQFLNILFSVPQISVKLEEIPEAHRRMLRFWIGFWTRHRDVLMHGSLKPYHPEANYPIVEAEKGKEKIIAVYQEGLCAEIECGPGQTCYAVNATGTPDLILEIKQKPVSAEIFDTEGNPVSSSVPEPGFSRIPVPASGLLKLKF